MKTDEVEVERHMTKNEVNTDGNTDGFTHNLSGFDPFISGTPIFLTKQPSFMDKLQVNYTKLSETAQEMIPPESEAEEKESSEVSMEIYEITGSPIREFYERVKNHANDLKPSYQYIEAGSARKSVILQKQKMGDPGGLF